MPIQSVKTYIADCSRCDKEEIVFVPDGHDSPEDHDMYVRDYLTGLDWESYGLMYCPECSEQKNKKGIISN